VTEIKVTDRRMFTPDGQLRDEFARELSADSGAEASADTVDAAPPVVAETQSEVEAPAPAATTAAPKLPDSAPAKPPAGLLELVEFLAGWALATMGDVPMPDGRTLRDLDASRFYIDLIGALHQRYALQLGTQELRFIEGYLDQLRLRYVSRKG